MEDKVSKKGLIGPRIPYKRTRMNIQTGITEEHIFTEEELQEWRNTGKIQLKENAIWTQVN